MVQRRALNGKWCLALAFVATQVFGCRFDRSGLRPRVDGPSADRPSDLVIATESIPDLKPLDARIEGRPGEHIPDRAVDLKRDMPPKPDTGTCPKGCASCSGGTCLMNCTGAGCVCPAGMPCHIICSNAACTGKVDCSKATDCTIDCSAGNTCAGDVVCGSGFCNVRCGNQACKAKVICSTATNCVVDCSAGNNCVGDIFCGSGACDVTCGNQSCHKVNCTASTTCTVNCSAGNNCTDDITCGSGMCTIICGNQSCAGDLICTSSCGCSCTGAACTKVVCPPKCAKCGPNDCKC